MTDLWQIVSPPLGRTKAVRHARDQSKVVATIKAGSAAEALRLYINASSLHRAKCGVADLNAWMPKGDDGER